MVTRLLQVFVLGVLALGFVFFSAHDAQAETGLASWYGPGFVGSPTASGTPYDPSAYTAASKTLPLGTELEVSYNGNSVNVVVNDRGPYVAGRDLDLSQAAAGAIGLDQAGVGSVEYHVVGGSGGSDVSASSYDGSSAAQYVGSGAGGGGSYVIQPGQTLGQVAARTGIPVGQLAAQNGIANPNLVVSGQVIHY